MRTDGIAPAHYDMRFVKPIDEEMLHEIFANYQNIITVEDGIIIGGFGSAILEFITQHNYTVTVKMLGIPDRLVEHGTLKQLYKECGYDVAGIVAAVKNIPINELATSLKLEL